MIRKLVSAVLILAVAMTGLLVPFASAEEYVSARTTLWGSSSAKKNNIALAAEAVNGTYVSYGETFSFNDIVGPRTKNHGYENAVNGRGAKVTGGGVSQVATTLYLALLDVPGKVVFHENKTYGSRFTDNYVDDGDLAIITDYNAGTDFSFTNHADEMYIEMWANDNYLYCSITLGQGENSNGGWEWTSGWNGDWQTGADTRRLVASSSLNCGKESGVITNIDKASDCVYDTTLNAGDIFSFNDVVGPRSDKYGYVAATNGRGVKVTGGGVAQVASVIWLSVKDMDDISIVEKSTYGKRYTEDYVSSSSDAILTDYNAGTDFSFRYTGSGSITIYTWREGQTLKCEIMKN
ncbi:MAG: VanW family protein [Clostridia bacterium]|nr:VanW family protein [Clostridia bacterium]